MSRLTRRFFRMKARYILTIIALIGLSSFITWTQLGDQEESHKELLSIGGKSHSSKTNGQARRIDDNAVTRKAIPSPATAKRSETPNTKRNSLSNPLGNEDSKVFPEISDIEKQEYYEEFFKSVAFQNTDRRLKQSNGNFLLPVLFFDVGPNNLYRLFKETIPIAKAMDRTLIVPPFHRHPRMENFVRSKRVGRENPVQSDRVVEISIFDQTYVVGMETNPSKSFDIKALRYFLPVESMERFFKACVDEPKTLLVCGELDEKRKKGIKMFTRAARIKFLNTVKVDSLSDVTESRTWKVNLAHASNLIVGTRCAGLAIGRNCLGSKEAWLEEYKKISPFVRRPVATKVLAKKFVDDMMLNRDYLAIHWRYDSIDWNDMCKPNRPASAKKRNAQICALASKLETEEKALLQMGRKIAKTMRRRGFRRAYLAGPPQMNSTIYKLRSHTPGLFTIHDVREYAKTRSSSGGFFDTNYMMSFIEQEICYLSKTFMASPLSSWSQSVLLDRMSENKASESVLDVLFEGIQGLPKLTWLFPEGSYRR